MSPLPAPAPRPAPTDASGARTELRERIADAIRRYDCPSCDHPVSLHQTDGCRFHVTEGTVGRDLVCPCSVPRTAPDQPEETR